MTRSSPGLAFMSSSMRVVFPEPEAPVKVRIFGRED
jgi:hypothetical protein